MSCWVQIYNIEDNNKVYLNLSNIAWFYTVPFIIKTNDGELWHTDKKSIDLVVRAIKEGMDD